MSDPEDTEATEPDTSRIPAGHFPATRWTMVLDAADPDSGAAALEVLCTSYWYPVYSYIRRWGRSHADAEDLTQEFFARLLARPDFANADPERGKFRTYLLNGVQFFLRNEWKKEQAEKRGGGQRPISIDAEIADARYRREPADHLSPDRLFERRWALTTLERAMRSLRRKKEREGKGALFQHLKPYLTGDAELPLNEIAATLDMKPGAIRVSLHRLRLEFRNVLCEEVRQTLDDPSKVDEELDCLFAALVDR